LTSYPQDITSVTGPASEVPHASHRGRRADARHPVPGHPGTGVVDGPGGAPGELDPADRGEHGGLERRAARSGTLGGSPLRLVQRSLQPGSGHSAQLRLQQRLPAPRLRLSQLPGRLRPPQGPHRRGLPRRSAPDLRQSRADGAAVLQQHRLHLLRGGSAAGQFPIYRTICANRAAPSSRSGCSTASAIATIRSKPSPAPSAYATSKAASPSVSRSDV
jgi:hypothetical protein